MLQVGETNKHRRFLKAEKQAARKMLYPVLQAEEDRRYGPQKRCDYFSGPNAGAASN